MEDSKVGIQLNGKMYSCTVRFFDASDDHKICKLYNAWKYLSNTSKTLGCRAANVPEGLSETLFCRATGAVRVIESPPGFKTAFDTYDLKGGLRQEIKSTSVYTDLTSFSPNVNCDELYWLDLYNNGVLDGSFDIYKIDINALLGVSVNKDTLFEQCQGEGKRPRISIRKEFVIKQQLPPIFSGNIGLPKLKTIKKLNRTKSTLKAC